VIARMNMGGPAYHVTLLTKRLDPDRYESKLVAGAVGRGEAPLVEAGDDPRVIEMPALGPHLSAVGDVSAFVQLVRIVRRFRPDVVHTHTAKAGMLGRLAARVALGRRPVVVHTYHGHVLEGYFGRLQTGVYRTVERLLGKLSDCLVGVSDATVDDLARLRIAPRSKFRVVPLGLELERFKAPPPDARAAFREAVGAGPDEVLVTYVGRLVQIKRVDRMLEALALARSAGAPVRLALVGDGVLRAALEARAAELGVETAVVFTGYRRDLVEIVAGTDIALLTSDNEGTPVWLIEAAAGGCPVVATDVGGVADVAGEGRGVLCPPDPAALGAALAELAADPERREQMGRRASEHVLARYGVERLVRDIDALYGELLCAHSSGQPESRGT
jgi:glycosyltransferase involved in cell wall biosynthesis